MLRPQKAGLDVCRFLHLVSHQGDVSRDENMRWVLTPESLRGIGSKSDGLPGKVSD